jgi:TetR/AcrR family transcriptional repressor of mexCD-oprJ operon
MRITREAVLEAATRAYAHNPRASTREVAAAAGISRATLHRLFPSRDALIEELGLLAVIRINEAYAASRLEEGPALQALQRLVDTLMPVVHQFAYLAGEWQLQQSERLMAADRDLQGQTERLLRRGQEEGSLRSDLPIAWMAHSLGGLLLAAEEAVRMGYIAPRETARLVLHSFLGGALEPSARDSATRISGDERN